MKTLISPSLRHACRSGFTLVEMIVATAISLMIVASLLSGFVWMIRVAEKGNHYAVVQHEAARSAQLVTRYIRNAAAIDSVDTSGNWVRVKMPNGKISQFSYIADTTASGLGRLTFFGDITQTASTNVVAAGLTKVMTYPVRNIFEKTGANTLRVAYRVSQPIRGTDCAAEVDTGIRLRNF
ncbi:MAG: type II secretion system protein [Verrucomicrobiota bacterium]